MVEQNGKSMGGMSLSDEYARKMNECVTNAMKAWWEGLSKEEILQYLHDQPLVTADTLRNLIAGSDVNLAFNITYATNSNQAFAAFSAGKK